MSNKQSVGTVNCANLRNVEPLFQSVHLQERSASASSFSTLKGPLSTVRALARDTIWRQNYRDGRPRERGTTAQTAFPSLLAFLIVLTCIHILPSSSIGAATFQSVDTRIQEAETTRAGPAVSLQEATSASLTQEVLTTLYAPSIAASLLKEVSSLYGLIATEETRTAATPAQETTSQPTETLPRQKPMILHGSPETTVIDSPDSPVSKVGADLLKPAVDYKGGSIDVIELAKNHVEPASNVRAAVCFKTMFGDIDIALVLQWVGTYC